MARSGSTALTIIRMETSTSPLVRRCRDGHNQAAAAAERTTGAATGTWAKGQIRAVRSATSATSAASDGFAWVSGESLGCIVQAVEDGFSQRGREPYGQLSADLGNDLGRAYRDVVDQVLDAPTIIVEDTMART